MSTVSLIGPDGVGKTSVAKSLEESLPMPVKYIYMGLNTSAANISLPSTRLWDALLRKKTVVNGHSQRDLKPSARSSSSFKIAILFRTAIRFVRKTLGLTNLILEEWYRQFIAVVYEKCGYTVIFDRHFIYDFYDFKELNNNDKKTVSRKIHDIIRNRTMSVPDLVICLDASGEVVFKRKGEFNIEELEIKRQQYLNLKKVVRNFKIINADRSFDLVLKDVGDCIIQFHKSAQ